MGVWCFVWLGGVGETGHEYRVLVMLVAKVNTLTWVDATDVPQVRDRR